MGKAQAKPVAYKYTVGDKVSEGPHSIIARCKVQATGEELAVKLVAKTEVPLEEIMKEVGLLLGFKHTNIIKIHDTFGTKCFVGMVTDLFAGGDLLGGVQRHFKEHGPPLYHQVVHVARQLGNSIQYLHSQSVVHRNIKVENYLIDCSDIRNPGCRVVLTGFGTATRMNGTGCLTAAVGTEMYWSPEFYDQLYGAKVDVWAMGITTYILMTGKFPFFNEHEIRTKELRVPRRVHPICKGLIEGMLVKEEERRPSSSAFASQAWVAPGSTDMPPIRSEEEDASGPGVLRDGADEHVKERRKELLRRSSGAGIAEADQALILGHTEAAQIERPKANNTFVAAGTGAELRYEWWDFDQIAHSDLLAMEGQAAMPGPHIVGGLDDLETFSQLLREHHINTDLFGKSEAKTLEKLAMEVHSGAARLMADATQHKRLVRVVDVVVLRLFAEGDSRLAIETGECYPDGRQRRTFRLPGTKNRPHENTHQTTWRAVIDLLGLNLQDVQCNFGKIEQHEEESESPSYPGLHTVYRKAFIDCTLRSTKPERMTGSCSRSLFPWSHVDPHGHTHFFSWATGHEAGALVGKPTAEDSAASMLVNPWFGFGQQFLRARLVSHGVDVSEFGQGSAITLKDFNMELIQGEAILMLDTAGTLRRIVDEVVLLVTNAMTRKTLVLVDELHPDEHQAQCNRLPRGTRIFQENHFVCARRIMRTGLGIGDDQISLNQDVRFFEHEEASPRYPGLTTLHRKRFIRAEVIIDGASDPGPPSDLGPLHVALPHSPTRSLCLRLRGCGARQTGN